MQPANDTARRPCRVIINGEDLIAARRVPESQFFGFTAKRNQSFAIRAKAEIAHRTSVSSQSQDLLVLGDVPDSGGFVAAPGCQQRAIRRIGDGANRTIVSCQVGLQRARGDIPELDEPIASARSKIAAIG